VVHWMVYCSRLRPKRGSGVGLQAANRIDLAQDNPKRKAALGYWLQSKKSARTNSFVHKR
jgi:hypothetical protein